MELWDFATKDPTALQRVADRYLSELAMETRESVCAGVIADKDIVLVAGINSPESAMAAFEIGAKRACKIAPWERPFFAFSPLE